MSRAFLVSLVSAWTAFAGAETPAGLVVAAATDTATSSAVTAVPAPPSEPWMIPASDLGSQRLFRLRYGGPEGEGSGRLTLWLATPVHYRIATVDIVGRALWSLGVDGEDGIWVDHRQQRFCRFRGPVELSSIPLSPFALPSLPSVLLGRMPLPPTGPVDRHDDGTLELKDDQGRRWTAKAAGDQLERWTLWEGEEPVVWWGRQDGESMLSERRRGMQIRWREVVREPLAEAALPATSIPPGYREDCAAQPSLEPPPAASPAEPAAPPAGPSGR